MLLLIVSIYLAAMLAVGIWASRTRISGVTDFLLAGRRLGVVMAAGALAATHFGGGALLGGAEYGFTYGISGAWYGLSTGIGLLALGLFTARRFRRLALFTVPDYLEKRYGGKTIRLLGTLLSLVALIGILAAQVNAAGKAFGILGLEGISAPIIAVAVFVAYTTLGGLWAATVSDLIQLVIATLGVGIAAGVVLARAGETGGLGNLLEAHAVGRAYFNAFGEGPSFVFWLLIPTVMYTLIGQDFYQRLFASRDERVARHAAIAGGVFLLVISLLPVVVGMGARALGPDDLQAGHALPWALRELMHPLAGGFILAAVLAAVMSTADSLLTSATSHVVKDIWVETLGRSSTEHESELLALSRWVTIAVGLLALVIGISLPAIVTGLIYSYTMYTAGVFVPVLGGVVWRRATRAGAIAAVFAGSAVALVGIISGAAVWGMPTEIYAAVASAVVFFVVSLATPRPSA